MAHYVLGMDTKTVRLAWCLMRDWDSSPQIRSYELKASTIAEKCDLARRRTSVIVRSVMDLEDCEALSVFIEAPLVGRSVKGSLQLAKIEGACLAGAQQSAVDHYPLSYTKVYEVGVQEWKLAAVGRGNANKTDVAGWLYKYWNQAYVQAAGGSSGKVDEDMADSAGICWYGMKTVHKSAPVIRPTRLRKVAGGRTGTTTSTSRRR